MRITKQIINEALEESNFIATKEWLMQKYFEFNSKYFGNQLPNDIQFKVSAKQSRAWGIAFYKWKTFKDADGQYYGELKPHSFGISLTSRYAMSENGMEEILIHEMVHIADLAFHPEHYNIIWTGRKWQAYLNGRPSVYDCHGPLFFQKEAARLSQYGWHVMKYVNSEIIKSATLNPKLVQNKVKRIQAKRNKINKEKEMLENFYKMTDFLREYPKVIMSLIERATNNFTQPVQERVLNFKGYRIILKPTNGYTYASYDYDSTITIYLSPNDYQTIQQEGVLTKDYSSLFRGQMDEVLDLEDKYENY